MISEGRYDGLEKADADKNATQLTLQVSPMV